MRRLLAALASSMPHNQHYEISGYSTAENLAQQLRHSAILALLAKSCGRRKCGPVAQLHAT
jgi:Mn-containing catalase